MFLEMRDIKLDADFMEIIGNHKKVNWTKFALDLGRSDFVNKDAIDLLDKLLVYDPYSRLTAQEAMNHSYFDTIRKKRKTHLST